MQWRIMVELTGSDGDSEAHEVHVGGGNPSACSPETLGLTLKDAGDILAGLQGHLVRAQTEEYCRYRRRFARCGR